MVCIFNSEQNGNEKRNRLTVSCGDGIEKIYKRTAQRIPKGQEKFKQKYNWAPTMEWLVKFVQTQARCALEVTVIEQEEVLKRMTPWRRAVGLMISEEKNASDVNKKQGSCPACGSNHFLQRCGKFKSWNVLQRKDVIRQLKYCKEAYQSNIDG